MANQENYLYGKDSEKLQIPYNEYVALTEKAGEVQHLQEVKVAVIADLQRFLGGSIVDEPESISEQQAEPEPVSEQQVEPEQMSEQQNEPEPVPEQQNEPEQVSEQQAEPEPVPEQQNEPEQMSEQQNEPESVPEQQAEPEPVPVPEQQSESTKQQPVSNARADVSELPPIKNEIAEHFNKFDESGRLFSVFKQYYTCLNEACGGTVRVTMKDGFCSLWNYDEWEEFAFVDIFEGLLRIAIDPRYTDALKSLNLCEAPRLISSRRNVICVQVDDLNNTVLDVLAKAFSEVGMQAK